MECQGCALDPDLNKKACFRPSPRQLQSLRTIPRQIIMHARWYKGLHVT